jgi:hypothetical protein
MLSDVRERTEAAVHDVEPLLERREGLAEGTAEHREIDLEIQKVISRWVRAMEALGLDVKGLWLVDFNNGDGYYCWRWPEPSLEYFHSYDEGFAGRCRIQ